MATLINFFVTLTIFSLLACSAINAQLSANFYAKTCPNLQTIVRNEMIKVIRNEPRMGASILRLFFHDCFVNVSLISMFKIIIYDLILLYLTF